MTQYKHEKNGSSIISVENVYDKVESVKKFINKDNELAFNVRVVNVHHQTRNNASPSRFWMTTRCL